MAGMMLKSLIVSGLVSGLLAGCEPGTSSTGGVTDAAPAAADGTTAAVTPATTTKLVDHDVEAPKVFQTTDKALWDGRPSLGGVWVATPDAKDPERVIMRNPSNGKFVIGALFRREADNPGPKLQISSDAADALGMLAGSPATLTVTALRRQELPAVAPDASKPLLDAAEAVQTTPLAAAPTKPGNAPAIPTAPKPAVAVAPPGKPGAPLTATTPVKPGALPTVPVKPVAAPIKPGKPGAPLTAIAPALPAAATPVPAASATSFQIGIFSVEDDANRAVKTLAKSGITATVRKEESYGKPLWSVIASGSSATLAKIKSAGFADAYALTH